MQAVNAINTINANSPRDSRELVTINQNLMKVTWAKRVTKANKIQEVQKSKKLKERWKGLKIEPKRLKEWRELQKKVERMKRILKGTPPEHPKRNQES